MYFHIFYFFDIFFLMIATLLFAKEKVSKTRFITIWLSVGFFYYFCNVYSIEVDGKFLQGALLLGVILSDLIAPMLLLKDRTKGFLAGLLMVLLNGMFAMSMMVFHRVTRIDYMTMTAVHFQAFMNTNLYILMLTGGWILGKDYQTQTFEIGKHLVRRLLLMFFAFTTVMLNIIIVLTVIPEFASGHSLTSKGVLIIAAIILLFVSNFYVFYLVLKMNYIYINARDVEAEYSRQIEQLKHWRVVRHGFKNHVAALSSLINENQLEDAQDYLFQLLDTNTNTDTDTNTDTAADADTKASAGDL